LEKLGVTALDSQGDVRPLIDILGEVAKATDDMGSGEQLGYLKTIFGEEPAAGMAELIGKEGEKGVSKYLEVIKNSKGKANKTAAIMDKTLIGSMKRLGSAGEGLAISVGSTLIPVLTYTADSASWVTSKIIALTTRFPRMTSGAAMVTAGVIGLTVASMAGGYAITFLKGGVLNVVKVYKLMQTACVLTRAQLIALTIQQKAGAAATAVMTAAQWAWNVAASANPIGLIVGGVAALVGGAYAVYKYWEPISKFFTDMWDKLKGMFSWMSKIKNFLPGFKKSKDEGREDISTTPPPMVDINKVNQGVANNINLAGAANAPITPGLVDYANIPQADYTKELLNRSEKSSSSPVTIQITVSPTINIAAGADAGQVRQAVNAGMDESTDRLKESIESIRHNDRRLSFG
jgi:hypothetical protein